MNTHYHHALVYYYNHSSSGSWSITLDKLASDSTNVGVPFVASFPFLFLDFRCWEVGCVRGGRGGGRTTMRDRRRLAVRGRRREG